MWVKGDWYLIGSVHDSEGIKSLILNGTASGAVDIITSSGIAKADYAKLNNGANMTSTSMWIFSPSFLNTIFEPVIKFT